MVRSDIVLLRRDLNRVNKRLDKAEEMNVHLLSKYKQMVLERREDKAKIATLKAALKAYENPHTPPN